jgi:putative membrane protein
VYPFFITAIGLILYGASVYILSVSEVQDFPLTPDIAAQYIIYSTIIGIASALTGVVFQHFVGKKLAEIRKEQIIEVL